jgi:hypothetical protein
VSYGFIIAPFECYASNRGCLIISKYKIKKIDRIFEKKKNEQNFGFIRVYLII